jgi:hypothetical protein
LEQLDVVAQFLQRNPQPVNGFCIGRVIESLELGHYPIQLFIKALAHSIPPQATVGTDAADRL